MKAHACRAMAAAVTELVVSERKSLAPPPAVVCMEPKPHAFWGSQPVNRSAVAPAVSCVCAPLLTPPR